MIIRQSSRPSALSIALLLLHTGNLRTIQEQGHPSISWTIFYLTEPSNTTQEESHSTTRKQGVASVVVDPGLNQYIESKELVKSKRSPLGRNTQQVHGYIIWPQSDTRVLLIVERTDSN